MKTHEHHVDMNQNQKSWLSQHRWISYAALAVIAYYLLTEHRQHVFAYLPFLFLAACPLMHMFMHGGHHRNQERGNNQEEKKS